MRILLYDCVIFVFMCSLFSCNDHDNNVIYSTPLHYYYWDGDTNAVTVAPSALDRTFQLKDMEGNMGGIFGVVLVDAITQEDSVRIVNIDSDFKIITDTIQGNWFTVMRKDEKQLKVILDKNEGTETRMLKMLFFGSHLDSRLNATSRAVCSPLIIFQQSSKNE